MRLAAAIALVVFSCARARPVQTPASDPAVAEVVRCGNMDWSSAADGAFLFLGELVSQTERAQVSDGGAASAPAFDALVSVWRTAVEVKEFPVFAKEGDNGSGVWCITGAQADGESRMGAPVVTPCDGAFARRPRNGIPLVAMEVQLDCAQGRAAIVYLGYRQTKPGGPVWQSEPFPDVWLILGMQGGVIGVEYGCFPGWDRLGGRIAARLGWQARGPVRSFCSPFEVESKNGSRVPWQVLDEDEDGGNRQLP